MVLSLDKPPVYFLALPLWSVVRRRGVDVDLSTVAKSVEIDIVECMLTL